MNQFLNRYILFDGARLGEQLHVARERNPNHASLYKGKSEEDLLDVAPYLFERPENTDFYSWYFASGWGDFWGVIIHSKQIFKIVYSHFRKFLLVKTEEGKELYFRFYDPRVLKIFLPTCDKNQLLEFFGPIESFIVEGDTKQEAIRFSQQNGILHQEIVPVEEVFGNIINELNQHS